MDKKTRANRVRVLTEILLEAVIELQKGMDKPRIGSIVLELIESEIENHLSALEQG